MDKLALTSIQVNVKQGKVISRNPHHHDYIFWVKHTLEATMDFHRNVIGRPLFRDNFSFVMLVQPIEPDLHDFRIRKVISRYVQKSILDVKGIYTNYEKREIVDKFLYLLSNVPVF